MSSSRSGCVIDDDVTFTDAHKLFALSCGGGLFFFFFSSSFSVFENLPCVSVKVGNEPGARAMAFSFPHKGSRMLGVYAIAPIKVR
jgi:hypothetical protein